MKPIKQLTKQKLRKIEMLCFDCDGVLVPRGTKIKQTKNSVSYNIKKINPKYIEKIKRLANLGYIVNISSGRSLSMLMEMFRPILNHVSITFENGSATWNNGDIVQHTNAFDYLFPIQNMLLKDQVLKNKDFKGFEPKEHIITLHAHKRIPYVEEIGKQCAFDVYCIWNGEAYDFGHKHTQNKGIGSTEEFYIVKNKKSEYIGDIIFEKDWKKWVWIQDEGVIMSKGCLQEVVDFMEGLK